MGETLCHWRTLIAFAIGRLGDSKTPKLPIAKARKTLQLVQKCFCALPCRPKAASASVCDGKPKAHRGEAALAEAPASGPCAVAPRWIASAIAVTHGFGGRVPAPNIMTHLHSTVTRSAIWAETCARSRHGRSRAPKDRSRRRKPAPRRSGSCHATCAASPS